MNKKLKTYICMFMLLSIAGCTLRQSKHGYRMDPTDRSQNTCDSIFLLSVTENDNGHNYYYYCFLDTLNNKLSILQTSNQIVYSYSCYIINPGVSIDYDDKTEGHMSILLKDGLISKRIFTETNIAIEYEYDSLCYLRRVSFGGTECKLSWNGDSLKELSYKAPEYKWKTKAYVVHSRDNHPLNYSLDLLNYADLSKDNCEHYLFAYLGLYGKLPVGNHYTIEKITYDHLGVENKKCRVFEESYTSNGIEQESKSYYRDSERVNKRTLIWNTPNIVQLLKKIRPQGG